MRRTAAECHERLEASRLYFRREQQARETHKLAQGRAYYYTATDQQRRHMNLVRLAEIEAVERV